MIMKMLSGFQTLVSDITGKGAEITGEEQFPVITCEVPLNLIFQFSCLY